MSHFMEVMERLKSLGIKTLTKVADIVDVTQPTVSDAKKAGNFPLKWAKTIGKHYGKSTDWIMEGKEHHRIDAESGSYKLTGETSNLVVVPKLGGKKKSLTPADESDYVFVNRYDIAASAGHGNIIHSEQIVDNLAFKKDWVNRIGATPDNMALIEVTGDSMEPFLKAGDLVLLDTSKTNIVTGVYCISDDGELLIKRCSKKDGEINIKCDNPEYDNYSIKAGEIGRLNVVGRVVWQCRRI